MTGAATAKLPSTRGTVVSDNWLMRLIDRSVPRSYHPLGHGWTPLSRNPYWPQRYTSIQDEWKSLDFICLISDESLGSYKSLVLIALCQLELDTSSVDDFEASGYCKYESELSLAIYWDSTRVVRCVFKPWLAGLYFNNINISFSPIFYSIESTLHRFTREARRLLLKIIKLTFRIILSNSNHCCYSMFWGKIYLKINY